MPEPQQTATNSTPPALVEMIDLEALKAAGILWPKTLASWRWTYAQRAQNGLAAAFHKVGRRVLVDPAKFLELAKGGRR